MGADINFFDWPSIESNLISDTILYLFSLITIPIVTIWTIRWRNRRALVLKFSHILLELCDFLTHTHYRDQELNAEHIAIFTRKSRIKEYRFVALCNVNVFSPMIYPKALIVISQLHKKGTVKDSYEIVKAELQLMKELRIEVEQILSAHSMHLDQDLILRISSLCFEIRKLELTHKNNVTYEELSKATGNEMSGVFGILEINDIYISIFKLIKDILNRNYFDFKISKE